MFGDLALRHHGSSSSSKTSLVNQIRSCFQAPTKRNQLVKNHKHTKTKLWCVCRSLKTKTPTKIGACVGRSLKTTNPLKQKRWCVRRSSLGTSLRARLVLLPIAVATVRCGLEKVLCACYPFLENGGCEGQQLLASLHEVRAAFKSARLSEKTKTKYALSRQDFFLPSSATAKEPLSSSREGCDRFFSVLVLFVFFFPVNGTNKVKVCQYRTRCFQKYFGRRERAFRKK